MSQENLGGYAVSQAERTGRALTALDWARRVVAEIASVAVAEEVRFSELDGIVGDGDFGYSLARGFEKVLQDLPSLDVGSPGALLKKVAAILTSRCGGTSGPIWGTAFLRAGSALGERVVVGPSELVELLRAAFAGVQQRGGAQLGDKTLLDVLGPFTEALAQQVMEKPAQLLEPLRVAAVVAEQAAEATRPMTAKRGRAAYTGERSVGALDPGGVAVATMIRAVCRLAESSAN